MAKFIESSDYDASIHAEILDAVTRNNKTSVETCQNRAIQEMRGYMSKRYNCDAIFGARGEERLDLVVMYCIDIAVYHLFSIHNPQKMSQIRKDRFEDAKLWLQGVRDGVVNIEGAPEVENKTESSPYQMLSNPKRQTRR
ncbi:phage protein Gp36 family protein [Parabacteroides sp. PF5-9]|uniref:phage protein Gp36 family protein n=1 Tax=Parabacteroides sp. PF5-9 TaxID=1742404 RepID=UPI0024751EC2|nr:phage protein Gp36 family protein [Parabacteroides sp. PF5-9]MDH6357233.1 phage gp36-like protein [Parabacteroides sp. PF5-9]